MHNIIWPPQYTVRKSPRAKRLRLTISHHKGIEVILPNHATQRDAEMMVLNQRSWIEKQLQRLGLEHTIPERPDVPTSIFLYCIDQLFHVDYYPDNKRSRLTDSKQQFLLIQGDTSFQASQTLLVNWLKKQALSILLPWLNELSIETGLSYHSANIRGQTTRWGSCSVEKNINLNYKLLFLPAHLVEAILLHELCHTIHMDHSKKFWQLMVHYRADALSLNKEIKQAQKFVPSWCPI